MDANSQYALRVSFDSGVRWQDVALPLPPGTTQASVAQAGSLPYKVLMLLPSGSLLSATPGPGTSMHWWLLAPAASSWALVPSLRTAPASLGRLLVAGNRLYWPAGSSGQQPSTYTGLASAPIPRTHG